MLGAGVSSGAVYWGEPGVRPVINLRADVTLTGDGTLSNPYQVVGAS